MKQSNPRIRFKEFNNKWCNYKLDQLGTFKSGIGFSDSQQGGTEGIPFFKVSDMNNIGNETEMRNANNYVTQEQIMKNSWKVINETPAIIFAKVGAALMLNRKRLVTRPFLIDNNTMSYSFDESWDKDFGLTLFQTINLPKYAQIGALPSYNASDIAMIKVNVPDVQEQSAIGSLFRTLDDLLVSYKDNLANYQALKATMLSKMFPKAGQTVPEIRLDGFERKWEKKKLIDLVSPVSRKVKKPSDPYYRLSIRSHAKGTFKQFVDDPKKIAMDNLFEVKENDLVVNITFAWEHAIAVASKEDDGLLVSHRFPTFVIDKSDKNFINIYIKREEFRQKMDLLSPGGAGRNRVLNVKDFINIQMVVPELKEQQAIGAYFSNLDNLITALQEKIFQLETLKKKLLQDMFI